MLVSRDRGGLEASIVLDKLISNRAISLQMSHMVLLPEIKRMTSISAIRNFHQAPEGIGAFL